MFIFHDSRQLACRNPFGAVPCGTEVTISLTVRDTAPEAVYLRLWTDHETLVPMTAAAQDTYTASLTAPEKPGLLWYYFVLQIAGKTVYYAHPAGSKTGVGSVSENPDSWQITVYQPTVLPEWYRNSVVYQIFPDRFARGDNWQACQTAASHPADWKGTKRMVMQDWNDTPFYCKDTKHRVVRWPFFGGNLKGIVYRLPYLHSLGIGAIYLNPIFLASSNHKYDTADYLQIDPGFGTEADFKQLCEEAEKLGIRIILDGVFSHTGDDSVYFNRYGNYPAPGAYSKGKSPYDSWYRFGDSQPCGYECWWGVDSLPNVEETDPGYQSLICGENGVIRKWLRLGASGWRLDVADELPDSFIEQIRLAEKAEKSDALLLGEVWEDASNKISYSELRKYFLGTELDCTMHYPFRDGAIDYLLGKKTAAEFASEMDTIRENYPPTALYGALNLIGTHDTVRILTLLGEAEAPKTELEQETFRLSEGQRQLAVYRLKLLQVLQFSFPGVPCIYYGDEAGMEGFADPFNRGTFPWKNPDGDLQYHVRMLSHLRQEYPILRDGDVRYFNEKGGIFGLERRLGNASLLVYVNPTFESVSVKLPEEPRVDLLTGLPVSGSAELKPLHAWMLYTDGTEGGYSELALHAGKPHGKGILCPVFSLPGRGNCGNIGSDAYRFLSAIKEAGYTSWMLLPLCPVGNGNSPYSSRGLFAMDPRYIDPDITVPEDGYVEFCEKNQTWLPDYALYTVLRKKYNTPWQDWPRSDRDRWTFDTQRREYAVEIDAIMHEQYVLYMQWQLLRRKANEMGISLIGDLPVYAALDSSDTWAHRDLFQLDENGYPTLRAGCPPDYFAPEGQDWGNPLYRWDEMKKDGYAWWTARVRAAFECYDFVRMDHFRGFAAYYAIPADVTAKEGYWMKGPGLSLFRTFAEKFDTLPIIAEDLGALDSEVSLLLRQTGFCGMNVWQFSPEMETMKPEETAMRVFFSGTHDNQTLLGFLKDSKEARSSAEILRMLMKAPAAAVIFPVQDILGLGDEARINVPGVPTGNWTWRMTEDQLCELAAGGILGN